MTRHPGPSPFYSASFSIIHKTRWNQRYLPYPQIKVLCRLISMKQPANRNPYGNLRISLNSFRLWNRLNTGKNNDYSSAADAKNR